MRSTLMIGVVLALNAPVYGQEVTPKKDRVYDLSRVVLYTGHVADLASTEVFLSRGYQEANPLLQNRAVRIAVSSGATIGFDMLLSNYIKPSHPRLAKVMNFAAGGGRIAIAVWNIKGTEVTR